MKKFYQPYVRSFVFILWVALGMAVLAPAETTAQEKGAGPIVITGDDLEIDSKNKVATYSGNVKVVQGKTTMFSDELMLSLDDSGKQLKQAVATGNVRLVNETITATGNKGTFYNQEQKIELIGKAKVWQGNNAITANRILAYLEQEVLEGYSSGSDERAIMTIYSSGELDMPFGQNAAKTETSSQGEEAPSDSDSAPASAEDDTPEASAENASPITIEADSLRLDNSAQQGRFSGDVVAVKDTTQLYADDMLVYITELSDGSNDVEKIEIFGHVKIINGTQTVTGDKGFFWNQEQKAKIEGAPGQKARIEDTAQNLVLEAPVVEIDLATNKVSATKERKDEDGKTENDETKGGSDRIQMTFGGDALADNEERFVVTEETLETLKEADVPDEVIEDLTLLLDREFSGQEAFMTELEKRIGADNADKYEKLLLKYSKIEEISNEQDLPSVTIQPDKINTLQD